MMSVVKLLSQLRKLNIRIWLENGSLRYKAPQGIMTEELLAEVKARRKEIINYLTHLNTYFTIEPAPQQEYYPVSAAQKRFYILSQIESAQTNYNISGATRIEGELVPEKLAEAFQKLVQRHEAFRTSFALINGELVQQIHPGAELTITCQEVDETGVQEQIREFIKPFDLSRAPLLRIKLLKIGPKKHILLYDMHHIISDLMSMSILVHEFTQLYNGENLPELKIQYKDFAYWQNNSGAEIIKQQKQFWLNNFSGEIPQLDLPTDYPRPAVVNFQGETIGFTLDNELSMALKQLSVQRKTTLFMTLLAGYNLFLFRLTGANTIITGTTSAGRRYAELENIIGVFVNTVPLRNQPRPTQTFNEFLEDVRENTLRAFENQDYQYEMLLNQLKIPVDLNRNPLFNTLFNPQTEFNPSNYQFDIDGLKFTPYQWEINGSTFAFFDLMILINEMGDNIQLNCNYRTSLFKRSTIEYLMNEFIRLVKEISLNPEKLVQDYRVFNPHDIQPAKRFIPATVSYREFEAKAIQSSLVERFEEIVRQYPRQIAAKVGSSMLTYETLNKKSNQVARLIRKKQKSSQPVALLFGNTPYLFAGIMGILKTGQAYLPLDSTYPKERLAYMLSDSRAALIVTDHQNVKLAAELSQAIDKTISIIDVSKLDSQIRDDNLQLNINPDQVAYIKYTSGSTGKPKGIPQTHGNVLAFIRRYTNELKINPADKVGLFSSYSHSAGAIDIFSMLLNGGTLYPFDLKSEGNMRKVTDWLLAEGITIFHSVPMVYRYCTESLMEGEKLTQIRLVVLGGEPVLATDVELLKRYFNNECVLVNMFGATEVIIGTFGIVGPETIISGTQVPVGYPVEEVKIYLLNENNQEVPVFGVGEIVYESEYLALDYLNSPEKNAQAYVTNPLTGSGRVFRSGDLGRMLPDGQIEFLGRKDFQVKIRGYRVELGEIEAVLNDVPGIRQSIVTGFQKETGDQFSVASGDKYLVAYIVCENGVALTSDQLQAILGKTLPKYMVPQIFIFLSEMPLLPNGKVDRKALPVPTFAQKETVTAPRNPVESTIVKIWEEILGISPIGIHDDFFDLGGHSLLAVAVATSLGSVFQIQLSLIDLLQHPTVAQLAEMIQKSGYQSKTAEKTVGKDQNNLESDLIEAISSPDAAVKREVQLLEPQFKTIPEVFEEIAFQRPDGIAASYGERTITYRELDLRSNMLGRYLRVKNAAPAKVIVLIAPPSIERLIGILGILKSGAICMNIDPILPAAEVQNVIKNIRPFITLTGSLPYRIRSKNPIWELSDEQLYQEYDTHVVYFNKPADVAFLDYSKQVGKNKWLEIRHKDFIKGIQSVNDPQSQDLIQIFRSGMTA